MAREWGDASYLNLSLLAQRLAFLRELVKAAVGEELVLPALVQVHEALQVAGLRRAPTFLVPLSCPPSGGLAAAPASGREIAPRGRGPCRWRGKHGGASRTRTADQPLWRGGLRAAVHNPGGGGRERTPPRQGDCCSRLGVLPSLVSSERSRGGGRGHIP